MAEQLLAARVKAPSATAGAASRRLFLCHNSSDKAILREVAEAVELEFGIPNFLDAFSIPAGVEFIPFIERELGSCHGCAIFLGANGWGRTHLWEAERAVARYRQDPNFKLIPVALPGVTDAAMKQLASGSVFGAINWVDFRKSPRDRENVRKLYAALTGTTAEPDWVRGGLTPYILRRDARRWREQGGGDKSLLYTGAKLREGQRLLETASDLLDVGEVAAFLRKSDLRQRRFWQTLASVTAVASVLLLATAITAWVQANLASQRQRIAVSRMLALEADRARGVDRQLLIAAQAVATTPTPEARAKLIDRLARWMSLVALTHFPGQEITAVAYAADRNALLLGMSDGTVHQLELELRAAGREEQGAVLPGGRRPVFEARGEGIVRAIHAQNGMPVIVGFQSGRVDAIDASGAIRRLRAAPPPEISSGGMRDRAVISLAASPEAARLAIGDARGMVEILLMSEPATPPVIVDLTDRLRATALAFIGEGMLAVGTATGTIELVDAGLGKILDTLPKQDTIVALAHRGSDGQLVAVNDRNVVRTWKLAATPPLLRSGPDTSRFEAPPFLSAAHIDPRAGQVALGSADGWLELREVPGQAVLDRLQAHRQVVSAFAFIDAGRTLTSVGRDGMVAIWRPSGNASLATAHAHYSGGLFDMLSLDRGGTIYVARRQDKAGIWQQSGADWLLMLDLVAASERVLPTERIAPEIKPDAQGFRNISEEPIAQLAVEPSSALALWSTRGHAIVSARWDRPQSFLHVTAEAEIEDLALSAGGTVGAALEGRRKVHLIRPLKAGSSATGPLLLDQDARSIALSPDGQYLAVGAENGTLIMYNLEHPKRPRSHGAFWTEPYRR